MSRRVCKGSLWQRNNCKQPGRTEGAQQPVVYPGNGMPCQHLSPHDRKCLLTMQKQFADHQQQITSSMSVYFLLATNKIIRCYFVAFCIPLCQKGLGKFDTKDWNSREKTQRSGSLWSQEDSSCHTDL